jgi:hypothetical protein
MLDVVRYPWLQNDSLLKEVPMIVRHANKARAFLVAGIALAVGLAILVGVVGVLFDRALPQWAFTAMTHEALGVPIAALFILAWYFWAKAHGYPPLNLAGLLFLTDLPDDYPDGEEDP